MKSRGLVVQSATSSLQNFDFDRRDLGSHDVALDVKYSGICHSDLSVVNGSRQRPLPLIAGHESAGVVVGSPHADAPSSLK